VQAQSEQLASRHKEEQARLLADLEARTGALTATQATVAEREAAHASLQQHCRDLQVSRAWVQFVLRCISRIRELNQSS
jgi:hypothetical protein